MDVQVFCEFNIILKQSLGFQEKGNATIISVSLSCLLRSAQKSKLENLTYPFIPEFPHVLGRHYGEISHNFVVSFVVVDGYRTTPSIHA